MTATARKIHHLYEQPNERVIRAILSRAPEHALSYGELRGEMPERCMSTTLINLLVVMARDGQILFKKGWKQLDEMIVSLPR
jgi:hypothetical protein